MVVPDKNIALPRVKVLQNSSSFIKNSSFTWAKAPLTFDGRFKATNNRTTKQQNKRIVKGPVSTVEENTCKVPTSSSVKQRF